MSQTGRQRSRWILAALGVTVIFLWANRSLVSGATVPRRDADEAFVPWQMLVADFAQHGRLLLWNPWTGSGSPDFAEPQVGALSPVNVLWGLAFGGTEGAFRGYWLTIWLLGGLGMMALARHLRAPPWGATVAALGYLFSGFATGHAQHVSFLVAFFALPWAIWRLDVAMCEGRVLPAVEAGAIWGVAALAGYPGMIVVGGGYLVLWAIGRKAVWRGSNPPDHEARPPDWMAVAGMLTAWAATAVVILAPAYLGFLVEGRGFTDRAGALVRDVAVGSNALHPGALATFSSSALSSVQVFSNFWDYTDPSSSSIYAGAVVAWLATLGVLAGRRSSWRWWILGLGLVGLGLAMGRALPFRGWLYDLFPPSRFFRHAAIFRCYFILSVCALSAYGSRVVESMMLRAGSRTERGEGVDEVRTMSRQLRSLAVGTGLVTAGGSVAVFLFEGAQYFGWPGRLVSLSPWIGIVTITCLLGPLVRRPRALVGAFLILAVMDVAVTRRVAAPTIDTGTPEVLASWRWVEANRSTALRLPDLGRLATLPLEGPKSNKNLPVRVAVLGGYTAASNRYHEAWLEDPILVAGAVGKERIWFSPLSTTPVVPLSSRGFVAFRERAEQLGTLPVVVHERAAMKVIGEGATEDEAMAANLESIRRAPPGVRLDASLVVYEPDRMVFDVEAPEAGYLLVTDRWAPGWRGSVDDEPVEVLGGTFLFRAVRVSRGRHRVDLRYRPFGIPWLLALSWSMLCAVIVVSTGAAARRYAAARSGDAPGSTQAEVRGR